MGNFDVPVLHKICEFYKKVYLLSTKIPKRDKFGIFVKIENICLDTMILVNEACFEEKIYKLKPLKSARIKIEILKRLIRICCELKIIEDKKYFEFGKDLVEISKNINNWITSLTKTGY